MYPILTSLINIYIHIPARHSGHKSLTKTTKSPVIGSFPKPLPLP
jgi:hypothetical protein